MARTSTLARSTIVDHLAERDRCARRVAVQSGVAYTTLAKATRRSDALRRRGDPVPGVLLNGANATLIERWCSSSPGHLPPIRRMPLRRDTRAVRDDVDLPASVRALVAFDGGPVRRTSALAALPESTLRRVRQGQLPVRATQLQWIILYASATANLALEVPAPPPLPPPRAG